MQINIVNNSKLELPKYAHNGDAGIDLKADFSKETLKSLKFTGQLSVNNNTDITINNGENPIQSIVLFPNTRVLVPTNLHVQLPKNTQLEIRSRSGWALKEGITLLNSPGTIDSNYTGSIGAILINLSNSPVTISQGDRVAQAVLMPYIPIEWNEVYNLNTTNRGTSGFGDSGKN